MPEITCFDCSGSGQPVDDPQLWLFESYCRRCRGTGRVNVLSGRERVIRSVLERGNGDMDYAPDYAEHGYTLDEGKQGILFANWNSKKAWVEGKGYVGEEDNTMARLAKIAGRAGYECEWSDEWTTCQDCGKALRIQPNSYGWRPSYVEDSEDGGWICVGCVDVESYVAEFSGTTERFKAPLDIEKIGYGLVGYSGFDSLQSGIQVMRLTVAVAESLKAAGIPDFLFVGEDSEPSIYVRGREILRGTFLEKEETAWAVRQAEKALQFTFKIAV